MCPFCCRQWFGQDSGGKHPARQGPEQHDDIIVLWSYVTWPCQVGVDLVILLERVKMRLYFWADLRWKISDLWDVVMTGLRFMLSSQGWAGCVLLCFGCQWLLQSRLCCVFAG